MFWGGKIEIKTGKRRERVFAVMSIWEDVVSIARKWRTFEHCNFSSEKGSRGSQMAL